MVYTRGMNDSLIRMRLGVLSLLGLVALLLSLAPALTSGQLAVVFGVADSDRLLTVSFLDVGQGDAIFIETPDGVQLLIDGGSDNAVLRELSTVMPFWDRKIDMVVATHPDKDHIGGLVDVLNRFEVSEIVRTENKSDTAVSSAFIFMENDEGALLHLARAGDIFYLGASTTLTVYSPPGDTTGWESNNSSVIAKLSYGEIDFMLTGDASSGIEEYLVETYGGSLESEVLKLGHHGSRTSTAPAFLLAVDPEYAVVSAGKDNRYGHPHPEVIAVVEKAGAEILSTALFGTITFKSDGARVWTTK